MYKTFCSRLRTPTSTPTPTSTLPESTLVLGRSTSDPISHSVHLPYHSPSEPQFLPKLLSVRDLGPPLLLRLPCRLPTRYPVPETLILFTLSTGEKTIRLGGRRGWTLPGSPVSRVVCSIRLVSHTELLNLEFVSLDSCFLVVVARQDCRSDKIFKDWLEGSQWPRGREGFLMNNYKRKLRLVIKTDFNRSQLKTSNTDLFFFTPTSTTTCPRV